MKARAPASVPAAVSRHARERPNAPAIIFRGETWTYAALDQRMRVLHGHLRQSGVLPGDRVILALDRSPELVASLLAVARKGATYVPVDPAHPLARIEAVIKQAAPRVALADALGAGILPPKLEVLRVDQAEPPPDPLPEQGTVFREAPAYMLFTSGSTGRPKGVVIPYRALDAFLESVAKRLEITPKDRILASTTLGFDISVLEILLPLWLGGTVELVDEETRAHPGRLSAQIDASDVTVVQATPTGFRLLVKAGWKGHPRLKILCGGEAMTPELASDLLDRGGQLWNMYGPTECTVWATAHRITRSAPTPFLGEPLEGTHLVIVDEKGEPADEGELLIGGAQVGTGYFRDPVKTDAAFIPDPSDPEVLIYRTGDRVSRTKEGLVFRGRLDSQVKVGGVRIELGEVEVALDAHPEIAQCAVLHDAERDQLIAYAVAKSGVSPPDAETMRAHLEPRLYRAAWPARYVWLDAMPMTATGKIDRKALPALDPQESAAEALGEAPATDLEWLVAKAWGQALGLGRDARRSESFLALGGTSLKALDVVLRLERWIEVEIPTAAFMARRTVAEQAALLEETRGPDAALDAVPLADGPDTPLFALCGIHLYAQLSAALEGKTPVYGVSVPLERSLFTRFQDPPTVEALAEQAVAAVRATQPSGPFRLAGASFGGAVAFEAARRLLAAGEAVEGVVLFDTVLPHGVRFPVVRRIAARLQRVWDEGLTGTAERARRWLSRRATTAASPLPPSEQDRWHQASATSLARYLEELKTPTKEIPVLVLRSAIREEGPGSEVDPDLGWSSIVARSPEVVEVPGDHLGILRDEGAVKCAEAIQSFYRRHGSPAAPRRVEVAA